MTAVYNKVVVQWLTYGGRGCLSQVAQSWPPEYLNELLKINFSPDDLYIILLV